MKLHQKPLYKIVGTIVVLLLAGFSSVRAKTLAVPYESQEMNQWCWNASSRMAMKFLKPSTTETQTDIAAWAVGGYNLPNYMTGERRVKVEVPTPGPIVTLVEKNVLHRGASKVLKHFADIDSTYRSRALTKDELMEEIDADLPVLYAVSWFTPGPIVERDGGHMGVLAGFDGSMVDVYDPWDDTGSFTSSYESLAGGPAGTYNSEATSPAHTWDQSLTISRSLDITFLIDTTGSMSDDIANLKTNVNQVIDRISSQFRDYRIAIMSYRDFPESPYGETSDYVYQVHTSFAKANEAAAKSAINSLSAAGGNDWPEAVYSGVVFALIGQQGEWRENPTKRAIIVCGDAPGHDPEPWFGGFSSSDMKILANNSELPIQVHTLLVGGDIDAKATFDLLSGSTAGTSESAGSASEVGDGFTAIIDEIAVQPRFPSGTVTDPTPAFSFEINGSGMYPEPFERYLELFRFDEEYSWWVSVFRELISSDATSFVPKSPLPAGTYQWRLAEARSEGSGHLPDGSRYGYKGGLFYETEFTTFVREPALPGNPTANSPSTGGFTTEVGRATTLSTVRVLDLAKSNKLKKRAKKLRRKGEKEKAKKLLKRAKKVFTTAQVPVSRTTYGIELTWEAATGATGYAIEVYNSSGVLVGSYTVSEPASPVDLQRSYTVNNLSPGSGFSWRIQALNFDRQEPDSNSWVGYTPPTP